jgi:hypothetical protein
LWQSTNRARLNCAGVYEADSSSASKTITTPPAPKITCMRLHEHDSGQMEVLGVSREPGREGIFRSREPDHLAGQCHKHRKLQPTSAAETVGRPRNAPLVALSNSASIKASAARPG